MIGIIDNNMAQDIAKKISEQQKNCQHEWVLKPIWWLNDNRVVCIKCNLWKDDLQTNSSNKSEASK